MTYREQRLETTARVRTVIALVLFLLLVVGALPAFAAERTVRWTPSVTENVTGYKIFAKLCSDPMPVAPILVAGRLTTSYTVNFGPGEYCYQMLAVSPDGESVLVPEPALRNTISPAPEPPTGIEIVIAVAPAFTFNSENIRSKNVAGFVRVGTECAGAIVFSYRGDPYRRVAADAVAWWNTARQWRVAAPCRNGEVIEVV